MKHSIAALAKAALVAAILFASCGSTEPANTGDSSGDNALERAASGESAKPASPGNSSGDGAPAGVSSRRGDSKKTYYSGDGGKGMSLAILSPEASGLQANDAYLPALIQGVLVEDFSKFSAIEVLDRQSLDKIIMEGESGAYPPDSGFARFGELQPTQYVLSGSLVKTPSAYQLKITVSDGGTAKTLAAHTSSAGRPALEDFSAIKAASQDLLAQMGVDLTAEGKEALWGLDQKNRNAETALAKGVSAQRGGSTVAAMSYYYEAGAISPALTEAAQRLSVLSTDITTGNLGEDIRNELAVRDKWVELLKQTDEYFQQHLPFEIIYEPVLNRGQVNFERRTASLGFRIMSKPTVQFKVLQDILLGLNRNANVGQWGLPRSSYLDRNLVYRSGGSSKDLQVYAELVNESGKVIASNTETLQNENRGFWTQGPEDYGSFSIKWTKKNFIFNNVPAEEINGTLTIRITKVNGVYLDSTKDYIRVTPCTPGSFPDVEGQERSLGQLVNEINDFLFKLHNRKIVVDDRTPGYVYRRFGRELDRVMYEL
jgi:TolB-like protein